MSTNEISTDDFQIVIREYDDGRYHFHASVQRKAGAPPLNTPVFAFGAGHTAEEAADACRKTLKRQIQVRRETQEKHKRIAAAPVTVVDA